MSDFFIKICNLSLTAGWIVLILLLLRPLLRKAPRWIVCLMWGIVAARLLFPFSFESVFSLLPNNQPIPENIMMAADPMIDSGVSSIDNILNPIILEAFTPEPLCSANPLQIWIAVAANVWILGMGLLIIYGITSYLRLMFRVRASIVYRDRIYDCDDIDTPFILGIFRPRIYLPSGMSEQQKEYV